MEVSKNELGDVMVAVAAEVPGFASSPESLCFLGAPNPLVLTYAFNRHLSPP